MSYYLTYILIIYVIFFTYLLKYDLKTILQFKMCKNIIIICEVQTTLNLFIIKIRIQVPCFF